MRRKRELVGGRPPLALLWVAWPPSDAPRVVRPPPASSVGGQPAIYHIGSPLFFFFYLFFFFKKKKNWEKIENN
jgi:hypothetical protein